MFPEIAKISDIRPIIESENFLFRENGGFIVGTYMVQGQDTFGAPNSALKREARGITFEMNGAIACRSLHKFFNVGEKPDTMPNALNWRDVERIMLKEDGSMVCPVIDESGSNILFKTKKSFLTPEANAANELVKNNRNMSDWIHNVCGMGYTPCFELTSPHFPIVVQHQQTQLTLLHIRANRTGEYLSIDHPYFTISPFPVVKSVTNLFLENGVVSWNKIHEWCENTTGIEGVVIQFKSGEMVKAKTKWYNALHHVVTFVRERDVVRVVIEDALDDMVAAFRLVGREETLIQQLFDIQNKVLSDIAAIQQYYEDIVKSIPEGMDRKMVYDTFAAKAPQPKFVMNLWAKHEKPNDYTDWYRKNVLTTWSLRVLCDVSGD